MRGPLRPPLLTALVIIASPHVFTSHSASRRLSAPLCAAPWGIDERDLGPQSFAGRNRLTRQQEECLSRAAVRACRKASRLPPARADPAVEMLQKHVREGGAPSRATEQQGAAGALARRVTDHGQSCEKRDWVSSGLRLRGGLGAAPGGMGEMIGEPEFKTAREHQVWTFMLDQCLPAHRCFRSKFNGFEPHSKLVNLRIGCQPDTGRYSSCHEFGVRDLRCTVWGLGRRASRPLLASPP